MIPFSLKQLRYFLSAAELGSTSEAARALHVSQPSISSAISQLENVLGRALLFRHQGQGVTPTPFGRAVMAKARTLLELAESLASEAAETPAGGVTIGCFTELGPYFLPAALRALGERWPDVTPSVLDGDFDSLPRALERGAADLAITFDVALAEHFIREPLAEARLHALLPARHPLAKRRRVELEQLLREPFILSDSPYSREYMLALLNGRGLRPQIAYRTPSFEMLRGLVANGLGVSLVYTRSLSERSHDGKRLVYRPVSEPLPAQRIVLTRHPAAQPTPTTAAVWDTIRNAQAASPRPV